MSINARFEHLDSGQRNEIYHAVRNAGSTFGDSDNVFLLLGVPERKKMVRRLAIRFGVKQATIRDVYRHVHYLSHRRRRGWPGQAPDYVLNAAQLAAGVKRR